MIHHMNESRYPEEFPYNTKNLSEDEITLQLGIYAASNYFPVYKGKYGLTMKQNALVSEIPLEFRLLYESERENTIDIYNLFKMEK